MWIIDGWRWWRDKMGGYVGTIEGNSTRDDGMELKTSQVFLV